MLTFDDFPAATSPRAAKAESGAADSGEYAAPALAVSEIASAMENSAAWWRARLDAMNAETARTLFRDSRLMLWLALAASWLIDLIWRAGL
jgi:hypothetical protein